MGKRVLIVEDEVIHAIALAEEIPRWGCPVVDTVESGEDAIRVSEEMRPDVVRYRGTAFAVNGEQTVRACLARGGRTGVVGATDTHEGKPAARTAVLAGELSRAGLFDALRHRRCYAVTGARIVLDCRIGGQVMCG